MKKILLLLTLCLGFTAAEAQITTGESTSQTIRTGNRAKAGDLGIYFGATMDMFKNMFDPDVSFSALPLINVKYMGSDKLEYRLGFEWYKKSEKTEYDESEEKTGESQYTFYPGVAYHFSNKNLLDVYVGGELPIGWGTQSYDMGGDTDQSCSNFRFGVGAFIGLQAYIANLPLALGLEYGVNTTWRSVSDGRFTRDNMTIDYSTTIRDGEKNKRWTIGNQVRLTLSYYFNW